MDPQQDQSKNQDSKLPTVNEICSAFNITLDQLIRIIKRDNLSNKGFDRSYIERQTAELDRLRVEEEMKRLEYKIIYYTNKLNSSK